MKFSNKDSPKTCQSRHVTRPWYLISRGTKGAETPRRKSTSTTTTKASRKDATGQSKERVERASAAAERSGGWGSKRTESRARDAAHSAYPPLLIHADVSCEASGRGLELGLEFVEVDGFQWRRQGRFNDESLVAGEYRECHTSPFRVLRPCAAWQYVYFACQNAIPTIRMSSYQYTILIILEAVIKTSVTTRGRQ